MGVSPMEGTFAAHATAANAGGTERAASPSEGRA